MITFYITAAVFLIIGINTASSRQACHNSIVPPTNARGVNRLEQDSNVPLFLLDVGNKLGSSPSGDQSLTYRVEISAVNDRLPFNHARISMVTTSLCGLGSVTFDPQHYVESTQTRPECPRLFLTNSNLAMVESPYITWKPPACGCVQFRGVVIALDNVYYSDKEEVENGPLTQTICVHQKANRELFLNALCKVQERYSAAEIISRSSFQQRHQVDAKWLDKHGLEMGLELRRSDNKHCCSKKSLEHSLECFDDSRRRRVDKFCEDGYPDLPLTTFRQSHMRDRETECCFLLGEQRYTCFSEKSDLVQSPAMTLLDFSLDETDPVNDLAEFATVEDTDIVKSIRLVTVSDKDNNEDKDSSENDDIEKDEEEEEDDDDDDEGIPGDIRNIKPGNHHNSNTKADSSKSAFDATKPPTSISRDFHPGREHGANNGKQANTKLGPNVENNDRTSSFERGKKTKNNGESYNKQSGEQRRNKEISNGEHRTNGRRSSGERVDRKQSSAERKKQMSGTLPWYSGYVDGYGRGTGVSLERERTSSAEKRGVLRGSGQRKRDWEEVIEPDFEDQGGKSVDLTLDMLKRKIDRLNLKHQCCQAGAMAGKLVYSWVNHAMKECEHNKQKYIKAKNYHTGVKSCQEQFLQCCVEEAISGRVVSSSEFKDKQFNYLNNLKKLDSLERQDNVKQLTGTRKQYQSFFRNIPGSESQDVYDLESDRRFQSMREVDQNNQDNEDEEMNGPRKFDEADNDFDNVNRRDEMTDELDEKDDDDDIDEPNVGVSNEDQLRRQELENKKGSKNDKHKKDNLDRDNDFVSSKERPVIAQSKSNEDSLPARTSSERTRNYNPSRRGGRSQLGRSNSRETRQRTSKETRTQSEERHQYAKMYHTNNRANKKSHTGKIGTLDSQEMVAAHAKKRIGNLDSKEMVDAYKKSEVLSDGPRNQMPKKKIPKPRRHFRN